MTEATLFRHALLLNTFLESAMGPLFRKLLMLLTCTGVIGSANGLGNPQSPGSVPPTVIRAAFHPATSDSTNHSFAEPFNFTINAHRQWLTANAVNLLPADESGSVNLMHGGYLVARLYSSAEAGGSMSNAATWKRRTLFHALDTQAARISPAPMSKTANGQVDGGSWFSITAVPDPADWMVLLCGVVAAGFIARLRLGRAWAP